MSSSLHRGYGHRLPTIRILLYSLGGTQCPEYALQHYGVLQITMGEPILHSMTRATFDSATNIASSMYLSDSHVEPHSLVLCEDLTLRKNKVQCSSKYSTERQKSSAKTRWEWEKAKKEKKNKKFNMLHCICCIAKNMVKSRAPTCLDSRHRGCSCVTPHSPFPIPWVLALSEQKHKDQYPMTKVPSPFGWKAYLLFPLMIVVHGISYRSSKVQRRVMVGPFILQIHYRHIHSSVLSITFQSTTSNGVDLTYFPMSEIFH